VNAVTGTNGINGFKNRIINGAMMIDQRNAGASVSSTAAFFTSGTYTLDRWSSSNSQSAKYTIQQNAGSVTPPAGFTKYLGCTVASSGYTIGSGDYFLIGQSIEGFNCADLNWGSANAATVTLSFWVRSSVTGTFGGVVKTSSGSRGYPFSYTISAANTWEQKTITIAGDTSGTWPTDNSTGIQIVWSLGTGSTFSGTAGSWSGSNLVGTTGATSLVATANATWYITGVQLEKGSTATSFDYRPYGTELALCQRYFQVIPFSATAASTTEASVSGPYKVSMRATPSLSSTIYSGLSYSGTVNNLSTLGIGPTAIGSVSFSALNENTVAAMTGTGFVAGRLYYGSTIASAEL